MLQRYERLILDHPVAVLAASLLLTVLFVFEMSELSFSSSSEKFFVKDAPEKENFERARKYFGGDQAVVVAMVVPEGETVYTSERLRKLRELTRALGGEPDDPDSGLTGVKNAVSLTNVPAIRAPWNAETGEFEKRIDLGDLIEDIPPDNDYDSLAWKQILNTIALIPLYEGNLVSKAGRTADGGVDPRNVRAAAVMVFTKDFGQDVEGRRGLVRDLERTAAEFEGPESVYVAGIPYTRVQTERRMVEDLKELVPMAFAIIAVLLVVSFKTLRGVLLPLLTVSMITVWTMGFMKVAGIPITLVTLILPPLMLALGSSYSIHMMSEYISQATPGLQARTVVRNSLSKITLPVVVCGFTTIVGFSSLAINRIPAIQDLGYAAVVGIFISAIVALFVTPSALMLMRKPRRTEKEGPQSPRVESFLLVLAKFNVKHRTGIFITAALLVGVSIYGITLIKIDTDFLSFFAKDDPVYQAAQIQAEHLAGAAPFNIVIEADRPDVFKHPAMLKRVEALQKWAANEDNVRGVDTTISIADFIKLFTQAFKLNDPEYRRILDSPAELSPILNFFPAKDFSNYVTNDYSAVNILLRSRLVGSEESNREIAKIEAMANELFRQPPRRLREPERSEPYSPIPKMRGSAAKGEEKVGWLDEGAEEDVGWIEDSDGEEQAPGAGAADAGAGDGVAGPAEEDVGWLESVGEEDVGWIEDSEADVMIGDVVGEPVDIAGEDSEEIIFDDDEPGPAAVGDAETAGSGDVPAQGLSSVAGVDLPAPAEEDFSWPGVNIYPTGTIYLLNKSADAVSRGQVTGLATALVAIVVVMSLLFLSPKIGVLAMIPNLVPIFILFGLMGFTGITLNFSTSLIAAIALGIGVDDTIHYIARYNEEVQERRDQGEAMVHSLARVGKPMIYTSVALFFGFIIFLKSDFVPIRQFGLLTAVTLLVALVSNLVVLPSLLISVRIVTLWDLVDLTIGDNPARYIKIFHGLSNHQAKLAVLMGYVKDYEDGDNIFREGEMGSELYVVLRGYVDIYKGDPPEEVVLATTQPGDAFGEMALVRHTTRSASARAEGEVKLFVMDEHTLFRLQKRYPKISSTIFYNITQLLSDRLQTANLQVYECAVDPGD